VARVVEVREATLEMEQPEQLILVVVVAGHIQQGLAARAVPALSSCPTFWKKAKPLNLCLLRNGQHQQEYPLLITWW
jgi:hypothetical protein